jgi:hypothetical protein
MEIDQWTEFCDKIDEALSSSSHKVFCWVLCMFPVYVASLVTTLIMMVESDRAFVLSLTFGLIAYVLLFVWTIIYQVKANAREVQKVLNRTTALHPDLLFKLKKEINPFQTPDSKDPIWIYVIEGLSFH